MNAFLRYTVLRLLVFLGCLLLLWLVGLRDRDELLLLVVGAALLSMVVSFVALKRFREDYSAQVAASIERRTAARRERAGDRRTDEEAEDEETTGPQGTTRASGTSRPPGPAGTSESSGPPHPDPADDDFR